jgi:Clp amino terminal domain, pathogenicity island component
MRAGWNWPEVAEALGVTRQAVHKKHARAEHLLLALAGDQGGAARRLLTAAGLDRGAIHAALAGEFERSLAAAGVSLSERGMLIGVLRADIGTVPRALELAGIDRAASLRGQSGQPDSAIPIPK